MWLLFWNVLLTGHQTRLRVVQQLPPLVATTWSFFNTKIRRLSVAWWAPGTGTQNGGQTASIDANLFGQVKKRNRKSMLVWPMVAMKHDRLYTRLLKDSFPYFMIIVISFGQFFLVHELSYPDWIGCLRFTPIRLFHLWRRALKQTGILYLLSCLEHSEESWFD